MSDTREKQSESLSSTLGRFTRALGSERSSAAPSIFGKTGGPLMGSLLQGLALGGLGYGGARLLAPLYSDKLDPKRTAALSGILGFMLPGLLHAPQLAANIGQVRKNWPAAKQRGILNALNTPASAYGSWLPKTSAAGIQGRPVITDKNFRYSTDMEREEKHRDERLRMRHKLDEKRYWQSEWHPSDLRSSIPVGHMSNLVQASGVSQPYVDAVNSAMVSAAGGQTRGLISPKQVFDAGMRMGVGYLVGRPAMSLLSKSLGAFAGLSRPTQEKLTSAGTLGIMLANTFMGRR